MKTIVGQRAYDVANTTERRKKVISYNRRPQMTEQAWDIKEEINYGRERNISIKLTPDMTHSHLKDRVYSRFFISIL